MVIIMGHTPYLLKPNLSTPYTATEKAGGNTTSALGSTIVLDTGTLTDILPISTSGGEFKAIRTDWIVLTATGNHYRITNFVAGTKTITIDGNIPSQLNAVAYKIYSAIDARCAWTDPTTITYIPLATNTSVSDEFTSKLNIIRYTNAGHIVINLKKTESTKVFPLGYKGNLPTNENVLGAAATGSIASQMQRAINYAMLYWPSTSPKYSNIFWYNGTYRSSHRDVYDVATTAWRMERCYMLKLAKEEDVYNNLFLKSLAVELV
jgi:hypothetical protein